MGAVSKPVLDVAKSVGKATGVYKEAPMPAAPVAAKAIGETMAKAPVADAAAQQRDAMDQILRRRARGRGSNILAGELTQTAQTGSKTLLGG